MCCSYAAGNIAVYSCEKNGFAKLRDIQALFVGWAVLETAFRQVIHQGIAKSPSLQGQEHISVHSNVYRLTTCCTSSCSLCPVLSLSFPLPFLHLPSLPSSHSLSTLLPVYSPDGCKLAYCTWSSLCKCKSWTEIANDVHTNERMYIHTYM